MDYILDISTFLLMFKIYETTPTEQTCTSWSCKLGVASSNL